MYHAFAALLSAMRLFGVWGTVFGTLLGAITGTLIFPLIGTVYAITWGFGLGLSLGLAAGIISVVATYPLGEDELETLRGRLSRRIGLFTALAAVVLVILSSESILWNPTPYNTYNPAVDDYQTFIDPFISPYLPPVLLATLLWAGLAAAYTTHRFIDTARRRVLGLPHMESFGSQALFLILVEAGTVKWWTGQFFRQGRWLIPLVGLIGALTLRGSAGTIGYAQPLHFFNGGLFSLVYAFIQLPLLGMSCGLLVMFLNRVGFRDPLEADSLRHYQRRLARITGLYTLITGIMMTVGILAPMQGHLMWEIWSLTALAGGVGLSGVAALLAVRLARRYGDWLLHEQERALALARLQKRKPKRKHGDDDLSQNPFNEPHAARTISQAGSEQQRTRSC